jgi:chromosome segregation ATPase
VFIVNLFLKGDSRKVELATLTARNQELEEENNTLKLQYQESAIALSSAHDEISEHKQILAVERQAHSKQLVEMQHRLTLMEQHLAEKNALESSWHAAQSEIAALRNKIGEQDVKILHLEHLPLESEISAPINNAVALENVTRSSSPRIMHFIATERIGTGAAEETNACELSQYLEMSRVEQSPEAIELAEEVRDLAHKLALANSELTVAASKLAGAQEDVIAGQTKSATLQQESSKLAEEVTSLFHKLGVANTNIADLNEKLVCAQSDLSSVQLKLMNSDEVC